MNEIKLEYLREDFRPFGQVVSSVRSLEVMMASLVNNFPKLK